MADSSAVEYRCTFGVHRRGGRVHRAGCGGFALTVALYQVLLKGVDDAAARRVGDVVAGLAFDSAADLDTPLLGTDQRIVAVQVLNDRGDVVARSDSTPAIPLVAPTGD